ncbi:glycosyltransferase family 4 protein [Alkalicoccobacillus porphyridii]|uniref:Glycosyltransferase family 4 protein n=1 Tax=Alkalicoccobacillus porphyridii TaxID=2597270 RepID=A0A554A4F4_9BACI|nr:glycosyltransferase family 4 protein [Alkalicoccobacillus porphyridii]TSB48568.1 glycosyltransferase family 4 protein [Alkalicoccobacillus porphyridii]
MKKKHICFVTKFYGVPKNGPSTFANNFVKELVNSKEYTITVISGEDVESKFGENVLAYKSSKHIADGLKIRKLIKELSKTTTIDFIYFNCFRNAIFSYDLNIPFYLNINDHHSFIKRKSFIWKLLSSPVFKNSTKSFVNSKFTYNNISVSDRVRKEKFLVTGKAINLEEFQFNYNQIQKSVNILYVGSEFQRKGLDIALHSIKIFKEKTSFDIRFDVVGESVNQLSVYKKIVEDFDITENVNFLGRKSKEEIMKLHEDAHFFILPSREEAFGVSLLEALASGTTVVASNTGGIPSIITDGLNGLLVEVGDYKELASKLIYLTNNDTTRENITNEGLKRSKEYDFKNLYKEITSFLP